MQWRAGWQLDGHTADRVAAHRQQPLQGALHTRGEITRLPRYMIQWHAPQHGRRPRRRRFRGSVITLGFKPMPIPRMREWLSSTRERPVTRPCSRCWMPARPTLSQAATLTTCSTSDWSASQDGHWPWTAPATEVAGAGLSNSQCRQVADLESRCCALGQAVISIAFSAVAGSVEVVAGHMRAAIRQHAAAVA